jgi:hypothetical protein
MSPLISNHAERSLRAASNRSRVLSFLRTELFSTAEILGKVVGFDSRQAIHKLLQRLEDAGEIRRHPVGTLGGRVVIWGITAHGQACAFDPDNEPLIAATFEPSRFSEITMRHNLDIQHLRVVAGKCGWTEWQNGDRMGVAPKDGKRPDALAASPTGKRVALEVERTMKTTKRYEIVLVQYLKLLKADELDLVVWASPTEDFSRRLRSIITSIQTVRVEGKKVAIDPARHHCNLRFVSYGNWPNVE